MRNYKSMRMPRKNNNLFAAFAYIRRAALYRSGFSLLESFIVVAMIAILSTVVVANLFTRNTRAILDSAVKEVVAVLREAQSRSAAQDGAATWGVHFDNSTGTAPFYALFKISYDSSSIADYYRLPAGVSYATSSIDLGSSLDITFAQTSGIPSATSSITLNLTAGAAIDAAATSATIIVNATGLISF